MNENDSERIAGLLTKRGAKVSSSYEESNLTIINTCAVREKSEEKLYSLLGRLGALKKRKKITIGVAGCVAQLYRLKLLDKKPFIDFVVGPHNYDHIPEIILNQHDEKTSLTSWTHEWNEMPHKLTKRESQISGYVTIMEGCSNFCSYCIVPFTRGREIYRPIHNILWEVKDLAQKGYKEIQLLGQNVNSYQDPSTGQDFPFLLRKVNQINGIEWIRFITSHPKNITQELAETMKEAEKVCHQLHLPLQSGSSSVLQRMNRGYTREEYLSKINMLRKLMTNISLSTDIIVGFPGETEEEFKDTLNMLEKIRYTNIFSFRYSPRPLTSAARTEDDIPFQEKKRRLTEVQRLQRKLQLEMNTALIGRVIQVLCLGKNRKDPNILTGRNEGNQVVNFRSKNNVVGQFVDIHIISCGPYSLFGEETH